jgi:hypothetical protein
MKTWGATRKKWARFFPRQNALVNSSASNHLDIDSHGRSLHTTHPNFTKAYAIFERLREAIACYSRFIVKSGAEKQSLKVRFFEFQNLPNFSLTFQIFFIFLNDFDFYAFNILADTNSQ